MRLLHRYLLVDFIRIYALTLAVLTFVLYTGVIFRIIDLLGQGLGSTALYLQLMLNSLPYILTFTIPLSSMIAALLLFGRLSTDGEISAMKASGLSIWQIITPVIFCSILLSIVSLFINYELSPRSYDRRNQVLVEIGMKNPVDLLRENEYTALGDLHVWVGGKKGSKIRSVKVKEMRGNTPIRIVSADEGVLTADYTNNVLKIELFACLIEESDGKSDKENLILNSSYMDYELDLEKFLKPKNRRKKMKARSFLELRTVVQHTEEVFPGADEKEIISRRVEGQIETNKRLSLSLTCFAFTLMAIPLGMKNNRRDSFWGIAICIIMVFGYYFMTIVANSFRDEAWLLPDLLMWLPILLSQGIGFLLLRRIA